jgi:putative ABC transport system substrate-binding protein
VDRRAFVTTIGLAVLAKPLAAYAQQPTRVARIGFLTTGSIGSPEFRGVVDPFWRGLRDLGYVEGRNLVTEYRSADGKQERFPILANDLVRLNVDLILAASTPHARAAQQATRTIPIVVPAMGDPVADGLVASLAQPGGNITGMTTLGAELTAKRLDLLKLALPRLTRVAILWHPGAFSESTASNMLNAAAAAARTLRLEAPLVRVDGADQLDSAFSAMTREHPGALFILQSSMFFTERRRIVDLVVKHQLPTMFNAREYAELGGLMAYGANVADLFRRSATYVDKILKGANPADLPIEQPTKFELVINLKTVKALGLTIPPTVLVRADEVIQ